MVMTLEMLNLLAEARIAECTIRGYRVRGVLEIECQPHYSGTLTFTPAGNDTLVRYVPRDSHMASAPAVR